MKKKRVNNTPSKLWIRNAHRVIYDLLTGYATLGDSLSAALEELAAYLRESAREDHRTKEALSQAEDLLKSAQDGLCYGWHFGIAGAPLRLTTQWTTREERKLTCIVKHGARAGYQIGLRQRAGLNPLHLTRPSGLGEMTTARL